jgi:hypothetical protein
MAEREHWSYLTVEVKPARFLSFRPSAEQLTDALNRHGAQGWELVSTLSTQRPGDRVQLFFKRPQ